MKRILTGAAVLLLSSSLTVTANESVLEATGNSAQWAIQTGDYANTRFSKLNQITRDNVGDLQVAWSFSTGVLRGHEGSPLVIGDVMYVHAPFPNTVYALDLNEDGKIIWKYEPKQDPNVIPVMCCDTVNRGLAYADGKIFLHQADTTVVALDEKTGEVVWSVVNGDPSKGETNTATVMPVKDKVIVGISGGEFGVRGSVTAYNIADGSLAWRAYSMGPDEDILVDPEDTTHLGKPIGTDSGLNTWEGDQWKIGGGTTWGWYSYDPELNLIYYGSGNPSTWNPAQRPGDNRWSMTIMARDADTGIAKWFYQMTPHDEWDYDGINEMVLTDQEIGGEMRKVLTHFDRNGLQWLLPQINRHHAIFAKQPGDIGAPVRSDQCVIGEFTDVGQFGDLRCITRKIGNPGLATVPCGKDKAPPGRVNQTDGFGAGGDIGHHFQCIGVKDPHASGFIVGNRHQLAVIRNGPADGVSRLHHSFDIALRQNINLGQTAIATKHIGKTLVRRIDQTGMAKVTQSGDAANCGVLGSINHHQ